MIIVTGSIVAAPGKLARLKEIAREHVRRSRAEPGCVSHDMSIDDTNADMLVFFERWTDLPALKAHFALPTSRAFVREVAELCAAPPRMQIYEAWELPIPTGP